MAKYNLSTGVLKDIMNGSDIDDAVLQILGIRKISSEKCRFRILISDGVNMIPWAMVSTQVAERFEVSELSNNSIIRLKKYFTTSIKQNQRVMVILEMDVLQDGNEVGGKCGNPTVLEMSEKRDQESSSSISNTNKTDGKPQIKKNTNMYNAEISNKNDSRSVLNTSGSEVQLCDQVINSISTLNPYLNKWVIRARVMSKSNLRSWSNSRGEGKVFSVDVTDKSGEVRITAFREEAEKYYDIFQVDCVYYISKGTVKFANKQFNSLKNPFEITLSKFSVVQPCFDENIPVPEIKFSFVPIDKIAEVEANGLIDVIGVCKSVSNIQHLRARNNDRELLKREIVIQDDTNTCVSVTLWGKEAEDFEGSNYPVLAIRSVRINEYNGLKQLSTISSSVMKFDPDIPEAHRIKGWYENYGSSQEGVNISLRSGATSGFGTYEWKTLADINENQIKDSEKGLYFQTKATILNVRSNRAFYQACPSETCNKKVNDLQNGMYRCEKCNREYPNFKYRLLTSSNISDYSGSQWVQLFNDESEKVLSISAQEFGEKAESNELEAATICDNANFQEFIFKCRTKLEYYNDESRLRTTVMKCEPINFKDYNNYLISQINQLTQNK